MVRCGLVSGSYGQGVVSVNFHFGKFGYQGDETGVGVNGKDALVIACVGRNKI